MSNITLITPTGDRHISFKICEQWMSRQTMPFKQWIVVDDGKTPTVPVQNQLYIRREPSSKGHRSLADNILAALPHVTGDYIFIIEDDDYYRPNYIETLFKWLQRANIVGEAKAIYYNIKCRFFYQNQNKKHASLCNTAFSYKNILPLRKICETHNDFIDIKFWATAYGPKYLDNGATKHCIGIKGMPGRVGIGSGHANFISNDPMFLKLKELIGEDYKIYQSLSSDVKGKLPDCISKLRRNVNGNIILVRRNEDMEKLLDTHLMRVGPLEWSIKPSNSSDISSMRDIYKGLECNIIGKGPSLDRIKTLPNLPTICINESIKKIEDLENPPDRLYCIQQDAHLKNTCYSKLGTMLLPYIAQSWYHDHPRVISYTPSALGLQNNYHGLSIIMAIRIAKLWGIKKINFYGCDSAVNKNVSYAKCIGYDPTRGGDPNRFIRHLKQITDQLTGMDYEYISA